MNRILTLMGLLVIVALVAGSASAQDPIVYPAKGQSQEQTEKDKFECYNWARQQTGFDPMKTPTASSPPPSSSGTSAGVGRGAAGGALAGLAIGSLSGNAGKGAAIGAVGGGLVGGMRRRGHHQQQQQKEQQWANEQASQYSQKRSHYNRAYGACLEAKGYSVK